MQIEMMPTDRLVPYRRNARMHSADQVAQIVVSILGFGFTNPILIDRDEVIIAGHVQLQAARALGVRTALGLSCSLLPAGVALGDPGGED
jgi:ParB-like chromosome segregation protein Spo0J